MGKVVSALVHEAGAAPDRGQQLCIRCGLVLSEGHPLFRYWDAGFITVTYQKPFARSFNQGADLRYDLCNAK